jgi:dTDP-4-amino-4,6-dideoxygalactose transaminase
MISVFGSKYSQDDIDGVVDCLKNGWTGIGKNVKKFELEFKNRLKVENFLMLDSGSNALYLALKNLNLPPKSEVILPSFTWVSCAQSILLNNLTPVFCDVDLVTQNVTEDLIKQKITNKTSAIMVVHYAGLPVNIKPIIDLGFPVIEDTAHAVDSKINDKFCGTFGDVGVWSFDSVKNIAVGEGGGIYFKDNSISEKSLMMRYCGIGFSGFESAKKKENEIWWEYNIVDANFKMLPSDIEGSLAVTQLKNLNKNQDKRKEIWDFYQDSFKNLNIINPSNCNTNERHSYFTYFIQFKNGKRNQIAKKLFEQGIYTTLRYHPLHLNKIYKSEYSLKNSEKLNEEGLNIPLHQNLSDIEVNYIVDNLKKII